MRVYNSDKNGWEMGSEDLDAWDATLQVCLARVLDDGADAARVLDHLAGTIASTHIPTGASATRAAELMLIHLETPPDAPALLGFANDTLVSTYPPEPQDKVVSMWLIRTATRVVDTCPVNKLCEVVGSLQEGLSVWIADQYRVFSEEEYAFDVRGFVLFFLFFFRLILYGPGILDRPFVSDGLDMPTVTRLIDRCSQGARAAFGGRFYRSRGQTTSCCGCLPGLLGLDFCQRLCTEGWLAFDGDNLPQSLWKRGHHRADSTSCGDGAHAWTRVHLGFLIDHRR